jgi:hypothetical protein
MDRLEVVGLVALALFPSVAAKIATWPGIPLILVVADRTLFRMMAEYRMRRYVPVLGSLDDAVSAIGDPPPRKVARIELPYGSACFALARTFVAVWCERWHLPDKRFVRRLLSPLRTMSTAAPPRPCPGRYCGSRSTWGAEILRPKPVFRPETV